MVAKIVNQKVAAYFDKRGESYDISWQSVAKKRLSKFETGLVRRAIESALKNSGGGRIKTLDIGVGTGRIAEAILDYNVEHYGIDVSRVMVDYCREKFKGNEKVKQLEVHDIVNPLPEGWGKFDAVSAIRVLSYTPSWQKEIRNIYEAMNPGGVFVFTFPNKYSSAFLPKLLLKKEVKGYETTRGELKKAVENIGFPECQIGGFARLLDTFYDWCDSGVSASVLFAIEKILGRILGPTLFVRLFYVTCKKGSGRIVK